MTDRIRIWTPFWFNRKQDEPRVPCLGVDHFADTWFSGCPHEPTSSAMLESARQICDELRNDADVLEVISQTYFRFWSLSTRNQGHIEQWPLALIVLAGLRDAGYEVVKKSEEE